jgi:hypothetical protein
MFWGYLLCFNHKSLATPKAITSNSLKYQKSCVQIPNNLLSVPYLFIYLFVTESYMQLRLAMNL